MSLPWLFVRATNRPLPFLFLSFVATTFSNQATKIQNRANHLRRPIFHFFLVLFSFILLSLIAIFTCFFLSHRLCKPCCVDCKFLYSLCAALLLLLALPSFSSSFFSFFFTLFPSIMKGSRRSWQVTLLLSSSSCSTFRFSS